MTSSHRRRHRALGAGLGLVLLFSAACAAPGGDPPAAESAAAFLADAEEQLRQAWVDRDRHAWVQQTYITEDTEILAAQANERAIGLNDAYTRYFLAHILHCQLHRGLCAAADYAGPLHRCSIYGNAAAGRRLRDMLAMGASRPWPEALEAVTGRREMDATAILDYFAPLKEWLDEQNAGRTCGW